MDDFPPILHWRSTPHLSSDGAFWIERLVEFLHVHNIVQANVFHHTVPMVQA